MKVFKNHRLQYTFFWPIFSFIEGRIYIVFVEKMNNINTAKFSR